MSKKKISHKLIYFLLSLVIFSSLGYNQPFSTALESDQITVVSSTALIQDFVENIGGDLIEVTGILVEGNEDPHTYEPLASEINALINADIFFLMGREGLEPWWDTWESIILEDNPDLIIAKIMNESMVELDELTGENNPHGWMSPIIAGEMSHNIYLELNQVIDSGDATQLTQQYQTYRGQLDQLTQEIEGNKTRFEGMKVVVHHPSFKYLYDLLGIERIAAIEEQHDVEPSAQHIQEIKSLMISEDCHIIIHQSNLDEEQIMQIARDTDAEIVWGAPLLGMTGANGEFLDTYIKLIRYNIWALDNPTQPTASNESLSIPGYSNSILLINSFAMVLSVIYIIQKKFTRN